MPKRDRRGQIKSNINGGKKGKHPGHTSLTAPLTPKQAHHMAGAEAQAEYNPTIRAAQADKRGSVQRQKNIGQMFQGLNDQIGESAAQTDQSYAGANASLVAHMNAAQQAALGTQGQIAQNNQAMTALTGADPSLTAPALAEGAAAANQRQITGAALAAPIAQAGASQAGFLRNTAINSRREGIDQKLGESKRRQEIKDDITALRKERAQKAVGNFRGIRGEERDYGIQRSAFNLDKRGQQLDASDDAFDNSIADRNASTAERNAATTEKNAGGSGGGLTSSEKRGIKQGRANAMVTVKNLYSAAKKPPQSPDEWAAFTQLVAAEEEISPQEAQWAVNRYRKRLQHQQAGAAVDAADEKNWWEK
jgi:hypothetical protein